MVLTLHTVLHLGYLQYGTDITYTTSVQDGTYATNSTVHTPLADT